MDISSVMKISQIIKFCVKRTRAEAEGQGWVLLSSCTEMFLGHRLANPADDSIVLIFDDAGFIAGSQSVIPASVADASAMARNPSYQVEICKISIHS